MVLTSPLVHERVWVDKRKYDAAERRYYEKLTKSLVSAKNEACSNHSANSNVPSFQNEISNTEVINKEDIGIQQDEIDVSELPNVCNTKSKEDAKFDQGICSKVEGNICLDGNVCSKPIVEKNICKKQNKPTSTNEDAKQETANIKKEEFKVCPQLAKSEKTQKDNLSKECHVKFKVESDGTKSDVAEPPCRKRKTSANKSNSKAGPEKPLQSLENLSKTTSSGIEQMSEVCKIDDIAVTSNSVSVEVMNRFASLEKENQDLVSRIEKMEERIASLEKSLEVATAAAAAVTARPVETIKPAAPQQTDNDDEDDGVDLFASESEEEDTEAAKIKEQRLAEYAARKSKKPVLIAKSNIILDVKPWDDETDMKQMEAEVRKIEADGLLWGASKLVPLAYGIFKLQISCVVEDDKISVDWLNESIEAIEDYVQSVDVAAFNKV